MDLLLTNGCIAINQYRSAPYMFEWLFWLRLPDRSPDSVHLRTVTNCRQWAWTPICQQYPRGSWSNEWDGSNPPLRGPFPRQWQNIFYRSRFEAVWPSTSPESKKKTEWLSTFSKSKWISIQLTLAENSESASGGSRMASLATTGATLRLNMWNEQGLSNKNGDSMGNDSDQRIEVKKKSDGMYRFE